MKNIFTKTKKKLTFDETQEIVTPFAFKLDQNLFGTPIASPWKRGVALAIDGLLIAMLSSAGGEFLAVAFAIMAFRMGSKKRAEQQGKVSGRKRRAVMRFFGAFIVFVLLVETLPPMVNDIFDDDTSSHRSNNATDNGAEYDDDVDGKDVDLATALKITGYAINVVSQAEQSDCQQLDCWQRILKDVPENAVEFDFDRHLANELFAEIAEATELDATDQQALVAGFKAQYQRIQPDAEISANTEIEPVENTVPTTEQKLAEQKPAEKNGDIDKLNNALEKIEQLESENNGNDRPIYSIVELIKGFIVDDLGLGIGWAALYFSVFTSRWNGRTPGKRLMNIRVLQLDGTPLSLWDSFGRFGGYAAGTATGLLGFLQIFWDPNRQGIHDKISATVVIDEKKRVDPEIIRVAKEKIAAQQSK
ncbi:RDD family protein [Thalassotalea sp. ND16A]|uniref:RDD family protein n=1 Tax=Thalassotalea sp. ND16A TaxID=1535422 RepID=UPI00051A61A8|nr:RDD family protein [Thalassotalea sp. ND16A]KGJ88740.1 hypothetical protein ND16A_2442 [Thalassotalea sp. ND16A]